jgi:hypothetical protein
VSDIDSEQSSLRSIQLADIKDVQADKDNSLQFKLSLRGWFEEIVYSCRERDRLLTEIAIARRLADVDSTTSECFANL